MDCVGSVDGLDSGRRIHLVGALSLQAAATAAAAVQPVAAR